MQPGIQLEAKEPIDGPIERVWTAKSTSAVMASVLVDGRLVVAEGQGSVMARDAASGKKIWAAKPGKCARAVHVVDDVVWVHDDKGFFALEAATGAVRAHHPLKLGARDVVWRDAHAYFLETTKRARAGPKGSDPGQAVASSIDLRTGGLSRLAEQVTLADDPARGNVCVVGAVVAFFLAPSIVEYALATGVEVRRLEVPGCARFSGLTGLDDVRLGVAHRGESRDREGDFESYVASNPEAGVVFIGDRLFGLAIRADASLRIRASLASLDDGGYLAFAGEHVARIDRSQGVRDVVPLPDRYPMGTRGLGLHRLGNSYIAFRWSGGVKDYALHLARIDPETLAATPVCSPLVTHPLGRNYLACEVDVYGDSLFVRADGRMHWLRWLG